MTSEGNWQTALELLGPLEAKIDSALAVGEGEAALRLAFNAAVSAAALVAQDGRLEDWASSRVHRVYVELTPLPLSAHGDGTLTEHPAYVSLAYQQWDVAPENGENLIESLAGGWQGTDEAHWVLSSG